ncbi:MAG: hypothetical protein ABSA58_02610 [Acetobacteraceae bacterium]|jgi:hypothetical protein
MSDSLALEPSSLPNKASVKPTGRIGVGGLLKAALESLVVANSRNSEGAEQIFYRYPPI